MTNQNRAAASTAKSGPHRSVFVTVGTTCFDALIRAVDDRAVADALAAAGYTHLVMQVGAGQYRPRRLLPPNAKTTKLLNGLTVEYFEYADSLATYLQEAALVISHAGKFLILCCAVYFF